MKLKSQYIAKLRGRLNTLNTEISRLEADIEHIAPHLQVRAEEQIASLRARQDEARRKLMDLQEAPDSLTEDIKQNAEALWDLLHSAVERARRQYKQQHRHPPRIVGKPHQQVYMAPALFRETNMRHPNSVDTSRNAA